ncbi:hypothetical protein BN903_51 [Halorubrum sp. AJ67]|nr:hypothetical protein BN903_51 [Halorubrum sp. AJ67]
MMGIIDSVRFSMKRWRLIVACSSQLVYPPVDVTRSFVSSKRGFSPRSQLSAAT